MITEQEIVPTYTALLQTDQWENKRKSILQRDGFKCLNCGSSKGLEVHHRQYHWIDRANQFRKPWEYIDNKLITLCTNCHQSGHKLFKVPVFNV